MAHRPSCPDPAATGLLLIDVPLTPSPDEAWAAIFGSDDPWHAPPGVSISLSMHPPRLFGGKVQLRSPDAEVERYLQHLDDRITATNSEYKRRIIPEQERASRAAEAEAAELSAESKRHSVDSRATRRNLGRHAQPLVASRAAARGGHHGGERLSASISRPSHASRNRTCRRR